MEKISLFFISLFLYTQIFAQKEDVQSNFTEYYLTSINCKDSTEKYYQKKCAGDEIQRFVNRKLNNDFFDDLPKGKHRITVYFKIDKNGFISNIKSNSDFENINKEFERVFKLIPANFRIISEDIGVIESSFHLPFYIHIID